MSDAHEVDNRGICEGTYTSIDRAASFEEGFDAGLSLRKCESCNYLLPKKSEKHLLKQENALLERKLGIAVDALEHYTCTHYDNYNHACTHDKTAEEALQKLGE
jgi:hypothetical protein